MASPFNIFRKQKKLMLAILGVLTMLAFVVVPSLMQTQGQRPEGLNPEVASTKYGVLRRSDIENLLHDQALARGFVANLAQVAENPFINMRIQGWGPGRDEREAVERMLLAKEAEALGMKVSDEEVVEFIRELSGDTVTGDQLEEVFQSFRAPQARVLDALRRELLTARLQTMFVGGFLSGQDLIATPAEQWEYFQRLNGGIQAEVAALPVRNFIDEAPEPTEAQLQEYFAKYADKTPGYLVPEPGFRVPTKAAFGYLKADFDKAVAAAVVTDEEVAAHYEENREMYRNPQMPFPDEGLEGGSTLPLPTPPPPSGGNLPEDAIESDLIEGDAGEEVEAVEGDAGAALELPADEPPAGDDESEESGEAPLEQDADEPAEDEPAAEVEPEAVPGDCQPAADISDEEDSAEEEVAAPTEGEGGEDLPADEESSEDAGEDAGSESAPGDVVAAADDLPVREDGDLFAADDLPVREDLSGRPERPVYKPLSEVAEPIRRTLKNRQAAESLQAAVDAVMAVRNQYYQDYLLAKANEQDPPQAPDMKALAAAHNMTVHETGLLSKLEAFQETDIGKSSQARGANQQMTFPQFAYDNLQPYQPASSQDADGSRYVYWQTEKELEHATTLEDEETRRRVVRTWKLEQARDIARKRAEELAGMARDGDGTLKEALAEESIEVVETGEFTWMTDLFGQGQPRLSEVHGVEHAGHDFMRTVFALDAGEVGVAANQPQDTLYVVRVARVTQSPEVLRAIFKATPFRSYGTVAYEDLQEINERWMEQLKQKAELVWLETPDDRVASR